MYDMRSFNGVVEYIILNILVHQKQNDMFLIDQERVSCESKMTDYNSVMKIDWKGMKR